MVYIRLTTFQVDKIKASRPKIDFYDYCLYKDFAKQGVARSCGKATDLRAQTFLGCYWAHGSTFKRSLLIIGEKKFFLNHPNVHHQIGLNELINMMYFIFNLNAYFSHN